MPKIEITQPNSRIEDWRVLLAGRSIGSIWKCRDAYLVDVTHRQTAETLEAAFKAARKQAKSITAA